MKDTQHLIEEIAQKQGEIAKTIDDIVESGGGNIPDWESIQSMQSDLGKDIEKLRELEGKNA